MNKKNKVWAFGSVVLCVLTVAGAIGTAREQLTLAATRTAKIPNGPDITQTAKASVLGQPPRESYGALSFISANDGWLATGTNLLMHTTNGGQSWTTRSTSRLVIQQMRFLNQKVGYALVGEDPTGPYYGNYRYWAVIRTSDAGAHWTVLYRQRVVPSLTATVQQLDCLSNTDVYALIGHTLIATANGGHTWRTLTPGVAVQNMSFTAGGNGWATEITPLPTHNQADAQDRVVVLHTANAGRTWTIQKSMIQPAQSSTRITFLNPSDGWLITSNTAAMTDQLFKTVDGGRHWILVQKYLLRDGDPLGVGQPVFLNPNYGWIPDGMGAMPMAAGLDITTDGGRHFHLYGAQRARSAGSVALVSRQVGYFSGYNINFRFVLKTVDGGRTFTQILPQYTPTEGVHFVTARLGYGLGDASDFSAFLTSKDGGQTWQLTSHIPGTNPNGATLTFANAKDGWIVTQNQTNDLQDLYRTTDAGKHWTLASQIPGALYDSNQIITLHFWNAENGVLEIHGNNNFESIYATTDGGLHWKSTTPTNWVVGLDWTDTWAAPSVIFGASSAYLGAGYRVPQSEITVRKSLDSGRSWSTLWQQPSAPAQIGSADFINPKDGWMTYYVWPKNHGNLYLSRLLKTTDGGRTWSAYTFANDPALSAPNNALIDFVSPTAGWMLVQNGLLRTTNGGRTWAWLP